MTRGLGNQQASTLLFDRYTGCAGRAHVPARAKLFLALLQARFRPRPPWR